MNVLPRQKASERLTMLYRWTRFGLRTSLIVLLAAALLFATYRIGFDQGRQAGPVVPADHSASTIYSREYDVSDIVKSDSDADTLIAGVRDVVATESWDVVGGYAVVEFDADANTILVEQIWPHHVLLVDYLHDVRKAGSRMSSPRIADMVKEAGSGFDDKVIRHLTAEPSDERERE